MEASIDKENILIRKVAVYVRVSTEEQAKHGFSIRGQIEKLKQYCQAMEWTVVDVYIDDGISGKNIVDRPEINRMLKDIQLNKINTVLIYKVDRLTRNLKNLIELVEYFNEHNCDFCSLQESIDTKTATGRMFLKIIGIFAEFERENIAERTRFGMEKKAKEGYLLIRDIAPLGYDKEKGNKIVHINAVEAELIRLIFNTYIEENTTLTGLARQLNIQGYKTKKGCPFSPKAIKGILSNPVYIGHVRYCRDDKERTFEVEGKHEAIINEDIYNKAKLKMEKIQMKSSTKRPKEEHYFCGTLYCGLCGEKMMTHIKDKKRKDGSIAHACSYRCPNKSLGICTAKQVSHNKVEQAFISYISNIQDLDVNDKIDLSQYKQENTNNNLYEDYKIELERLTQKQTKVMNLFIAEEIDFDEFAKIKNILKTQIKDVTNKLSQIEREKNENSIQITENEIITNIKENWLLLNNNEKMDFLNNFVDKIIFVNEPQKDSVYGNPRIKEIKFHKE